MLIPKPLLEDIVNGKCLPFIGAGFSLNTELPSGEKTLDWNDLANELIKDLNTTKTDPAEIAEEYEAFFGRPKLIEKLSDLLHISELIPSSVHKQFTSITSFDLVYTTNFDNLLEDTYKQFQISVKTIVEEYQLSEYAGKLAVNIVKMHGDFSHSKYLVITKSDYDNYPTNYDLIISHLSAFLMTRTPLFIGYSLRDTNFRRIKEILDKKLGKNLRKGYVVLFNPTEVDIEEYKKMQLHVIQLNSDTQSNEELLLAFLKEIRQYEMSESMENDLSIATNKKIVGSGEILEIYGQIKEVQNTMLSIKIINDIGEIVLNNVMAISSNIIKKEIPIHSDDWKLNTEYIILMECGGKTVTTNFYVTEQFNLVIQTDKTVYLRGSDMILTIINPSKISDIPINVEINGPDGLVYKNTIPIAPDGNGIYQEIVLIDGKNWSNDLGAEFIITAEYGGKITNLTFLTSNFGAAVELDQKVYTWTDKVYITVIAPDFNHDPRKIESIFVRISTSRGTIPNYRLVESGMDTGIFTGEIILSGFSGHNITEGYQRFEGMGITQGYGPTNGIISVSNDDFISIAFNIADNQPVVGSALIKWNIGEVVWLQAVYPLNGKGIVRVIDPDMNLNPEKIDSFMISIWSDTDPKGIEIEVRETNEAAGIFEGEVIFSDKESIGSNLRVSDGDIISAKYTDRTLPPPYSVNDVLDITGATAVSSNPESVISPLDRIISENPFVIDQEDNPVSTIPQYQQVKIGSVLQNNLNKETDFVMIVKIRQGILPADNLWYEGKMGAKQTTRPFVLWTPNEKGEYYVEIFVWKSLDNTEALSKPLDFSIFVN